MRVKRCKPRAGLRMVRMRRRVVTVFLARGGRVLVLKRSAAVATYRGRWAGISGSVETGELPAAAASRELGEETGLRGGSEARLVRQGLHVDVDDGAGVRALRFRVHPFRWDLAEGAEPRLDFEHDEARWMAPDELIPLAAAGETVPELDEALARVWDPPAALPPPFRPDARALFDDRTSGAAELARRAVALVHAGAPAERVAALRPHSTVNGAAPASAPSTVDDRLNVAMVPAAGRRRRRAACAERAASSSSAATSRPG